MDKQNRTKKYFASALKQLTDETPLKLITVQKLCNRCELNRGTFYYHFRDIQDLINWIYHNEVVVPAREQCIIGQRQPDYRNLTLMILSLTYQEPRFYAKAIAMQGQNSLSEFMLEESQTTWQMILDRILETRGSTFEELPSYTRRDLTYAIRYFCYGHYYASIQWLKDGMQIPPEVFSTIIDKAAWTGTDIIDELICGKVLITQ